jgi:putative peptide zinc metalloprotease protein
MGEIIDRSHFRFLAVIQQEQADYLFKQDFLATELRLVGQSDVNIRIDKVDIIPFQSQTLPSVALGWMGGGDIPVNTNDPAADKALDSFYTLYGQVPVNAGDFTRLHGLSGTVRFSLPPQSLFVQAYRSLQQTAQKRYAL